MKPIYITILLLSFSIPSFTQFYFETGYHAGIPLQEMNKNIQTVHQFKIAGMYRLPNELKMVHVGLETGYGNYANLRMPTTFTLNNIPTNTFVNYSSSTLSANAVLQVFLVQKFAISPYITTKAGYQKWYSNITVEDPLDEDGCTPLDKKNIIKDRTGTFSYGGGLQIDMSSFMKIKQKRKHFLDIGVVQTRGGNIDYVNTRKLKDHDHTPNNTGDGSKPVTMRFINATSNLIHDHKVAELYNTPLRLLEFKLTYKFAF